MSRHVPGISGRLSLRAPQRRSLEILHRVMELARPEKGRSPEEALAAVRAEFPSVEDFERSFSSLCFALATGVGKTRLMGAFIAYLHLEHGIRHFFVLAPNLTIYDKLIADFTPNTPKYVFEGLGEFAVQRPTIVTGDSYEQIAPMLDLTTREGVTINIFNIAKFGTRSKEARKVWRLTELLGQSYFDYLAGLDDLVLLMDEAHRYRAEASMQSLEELRPLLGLELTATPQVETGAKPSRFRNVIFDYPLAQAMQDGFVKEPAVATRADFNPKTMTAEALEQLKLEDGIRIHENAKVELEVHAQQTGARRVKPFMLVVARDTEHADGIVRLIESDTFFEGRYKGRVIQVHSGQKGAEKDENVARLLAVESPDEPTEVVVHVNMLKEGWDVTNLYTIVPLRAADSRTLVEQSIGRGLRLPYGRRTGVAPVDRLTIVAHDRFEEIVDEARKGGFTFSTIHLGKDVPDQPKSSVIVNPTGASILGGAPAIRTGAAGESGSVAAGALGLGRGATPQPRFQTPGQQQVARLTLECVQRLTRDAQQVPSPAALQSPAVQARVVADVRASIDSQGLLFADVDDAVLVSTVADAIAAHIQHTIAIPRVNVLPKGDTRAGFEQFDLDLRALRLQPVAKEILIRSLTTEEVERLGALEGGQEEERLEDYVVRGLIDHDDVSYDDNADVLYDLAGQVVRHLSGYLKSRDEIRNVLIFHQRQVTNLVHAQMQDHTWEEPVPLEVIVSSGFTEIGAQAFTLDAGEVVRMFDVPVTNKSDIRGMLFGGFEKCLYPTQKFDTDTERRFAVLLEREPTVEKWFKPGRKVFLIRYTSDHDYEPDFVVETRTEKLLCEPKRGDQLTDSVVLAKAHAASQWCRHATDYELQHGGKPWRYLLIPHDYIAANSSLDGLIERFTVTAADEPPRTGG